ncbi:MAG: pyrroloquinoline quinone biosynthesis protein PqqE, partial [Caballeronia mineralivorans]|nr:pyrroloquinoline quinone biosynthesis protein PqqE [Caballeronia mineralivorans]MEA3096916.1 PqqA peptide cyclase [Caballeronia mineralivorans]
GGCRCQAYLLTGDPANADPVCDKSPHHEAVINVVRKAAVERESDEHPIMFRNDSNSHRLAAARDGRGPDYHSVADLAGVRK